MNKWNRGDFFVLRGADREIEWFGMAIGSVLAVVIPHHEFHSPERYDQILIPKHAERVPESAPPEAARDLFQMALVATKGLM